MGLGALFYPWGIVLQVIAVLHFIRRRPDTFWLWIIIIGGGLGAAIYMVAEMLPDVNLLRGAVNSMGRRKRIRDLEAVVLENAAVGNLEELADLYLEERQFARAKALYDKVIASRSDSLDAFYRRGLAELELGDAPAALADLDLVVGKEPKYDFNRAIGLLAHACALANQPSAPTRSFRKPSKSRRSPKPTTTTRAFSLFRSGQPKRATGRSAFSRKSRRCRATCGGSSGRGSGRRVR